MREARDAWRWMSDQKAAHPQELRFLRAPRCRCLFCDCLASRRPWLQPVAGKLADSTTGWTYRNLLRDRGHWWEWREQ